MGQSQREIARAEGRSRPTIARIVKGEEMQAFVQEMRERFYGLAPDALATIEYELREQKDARNGLEVLRDIGVRPQKGGISAVAGDDTYRIRLRKTAQAHRSCFARSEPADGSAVGVGNRNGVSKRLAGKHGNCKRQKITRHG
jgi:transcriptional regulator with XRE-family HTH domain